MQKEEKDMFFKKKSMEKKYYNKEQKMPVLKCSICNGEQVAGFQDKKTGAFEDIMFIRSQQELEQFMDMYGITEPLKKIY